MTYRIIRPSGWVHVFALHVDGTWQLWYRYNPRIAPWGDGELERMLGA